MAVGLTKIAIVRTVEFGLAVACVLAAFSLVGDPMLMSMALGAGWIFAAVGIVTATKTTVSKLLWSIIILVAFVIVGTLLYFHAKGQNNVKPELALSQIANYDLQQKIKKYNTELRDFERKWQLDEQKLSSDTIRDTSNIDEIKDPQRYKNIVMEDAGKMVDMNYQYIKTFISSYQREGQALRDEMYKREKIEKPIFSGFERSLNDPSGMQYVEIDYIINFLNELADKLPP